MDQILQTCLHPVLGKCKYNMSGTSFSSKIDLRYTYTIRKIGTIVPGRNNNKPRGSTTYTKGKFISYDLLPVQYSELTLSIDFLTLNMKYIWCQCVEQVYLLRQTQPLEFCLHFPPTYTVYPANNNTKIS